MITYECPDDVAWVTLDRPEKKNALTLPGLRDLAAAFDRADDEARAVVLEGAGDAFCAGDDIASLADLGRDTDVEELTDAMYHALFGAEHVDVPVIAKVDGLAYGGGFELAAAADLAVATPESSFALPETRIGAYPPYAVARIAELGGRKRMMDLVLTGEAIDADTAERWGLVNSVTDDVDAAVADYLDHVRSAPEGAIRLAKRYATEAIVDAGEASAVAGGFARVAADDDCLAAAREFLER